MKDKYSAKDHYKELEFDKYFDEGGDITPYLDIKNATRPNRQVQRVNIDFPIRHIKAIPTESVDKWLLEKTKCLIFPMAVLTFWYTYYTIIVWTLFMTQ